MTTAPPLVPSTLPALVLSSDLDSWTPPSGGQALARQLGSSARWVLVPNTMHVSGLLDTVGCASGIIDAFIAAPHQLAHLDTSCRRAIPEHHTAGAFIVVAADARPADPARGNRAGVDSLRLATVAVDTVGDAISQDLYVGRGTGVGLRGGTFVAVGSSTRVLTLDRLRLVSDATVSGTITWVPRARAVDARLVVDGPTGSITVHVTWNGLVPHGLARVDGEANGTARIAATLPAA